MRTDDALQFLRSHQPLPPTREIGEDLLRQFDSVRKHFAQNPDIRCVPLLLNSFGEGDGHGVYQLVEGTILGHPENVVVPALIDGLQNRSGSVRYWNAQIAANYPTPELIEPLAQLVRSGDVDERIAAVTALEVIGTRKAKHVLRDALKFDLEREVRDLIREAIDHG